MSEFALGACFAFLAMTAMVFMTGYGFYFREFWRDSKLPPRLNA